MITSRKIDLFKKDLREALAKLEKKHGVVASIGNVTYTNSEFRFKTTVNEGKRSSSPVLSTDDFVVGQRVKINHKSISENDKFEIIKINRIKIKVRLLEGKRMIIVPPSLLERI